MAGRQLEAHGEMPSPARWWVAGALGLVVVVVAACSSGSASPSATTTKTSSSPAATSASAPATVTLARVGSVGTVLVNGAGMTLYRYSPDGTGKSVCNGGCASIWPPLLVSAGTRPVGGAGVPAGQLGTVTRDDGTIQVTYKGMPLYTYVGDKKTGEATGQSVGGTWFVVSTASGAAGPPAGGTTATTRGSGGYGY